MAGNGNSLNDKTYAVDLKLRPVVGDGPMTRPQAVSKLWEYVKAHRLQNPADGRVILCDGTMREAFGVQSMTMFEMNRLLSPLLSSAT